VPRLWEESVAAPAAVREERTRILRDLLDQLDDVSDAAVEAITAEIPAYAEQGAAFLRDVRDQVRHHYQANLHCFLEDRMVTLEDITFVRSAALRRARVGFALTDYLNAYRVGQHVLWEAIVSCAGETHAGHAAALTLATPVMRYADFASTRAANAYVEYQQHVVADADRERRDLLEHLLSGEMPVRGPLLAAAEAHGIEPGVTTMVAAAVPVGADPDADVPRAASAAIAHFGMDGKRTLVVVRQAEIVAVPVLAPGDQESAVCARLEALQERLAREGMLLAMGVSTQACGVSELPRAYREARGALAFVAEAGGVAALPRLSPFDYLARRADPTARRLVDPRIATFLSDDRDRGGVLTGTIRAFAEADLNLRVAAEHLQIHPNTAQYRLGKIEERTGCSMRCIADLQALLVAIALDDEALP
jgi:PucR-like helix-turn-helix protein/diguanylate cyclase with GGDEF domain